MHAEFRISSIDCMCAFDAESFVRIHQLKHRSLVDANSRPNFVELPDGGRNSVKRFRPRVKIQFIFENLVCIESSEITGKLERLQHERQKRTDWDASEIRTKRYRCHIGEAIVASLPFFVSGRDLKIRLMQLAPDLNVEETAIVKKVFPYYFQLQDSNLCIGVAKLNLRDLLLTNSGVSVTLQPKKSMISAVEEVNLNTIATNGMFGKDVGGSAVLTFQVLSFIFNHKSLPSLLCFTPTESSAVLPFLNANTKNNTGSVENDLSVESLVELRQQMSSAAVRFVLVPYMVIIDAILRINDAVSWRNPFRTLLLLCIFIVVLIADVAEMGLMLGILVEMIAALRMTVFFYRIPPRLNQSTETVIFSAERKESFKAILYGSHNHIINSMVRSRIFFSQGLQADCYFELTILFHRIQKAKNKILPCLAALVLSLFALSAETLTLLFVLAVFLVNPIMLRISFSRFRKTWSRQLSSGTLWKAIALNRPMRVSRVVQVTDLQKKQQINPCSLSIAPIFTPSPTRSLVNFPVAPLPYLVATEEYRHRRGLSFNASQDRQGGQIRQTDEMNLFPNLDSQGTKFLNYGVVGENTTTFNTSNNNTQLAPFSTKMLARTCSDTTKYDTQQKSLLTFVVIVISTDILPGNNIKCNTISSSGGGNSAIVQKLRRILQRARALRRSPQVSLQKEQYQSYFGSVLAFLQFLRRQCILETYITLSTVSNPNLTKGTVKLDQLAHLSWLIEKGEDDGITSTMLAHSNHQVLLGKLQSIHHIDSSARAFALLSAYLLQGSRLSVYYGNGSKGCSVIIPLKMGSNDIEVAPEPNPCPKLLQEALVGFWKGWKENESPIDINTDVVLQVIATYKDSWGNDGATSGALQDYNQMIMALQDDNETARDTSKRLLQTFSAPSYTLKRQRTSNISFANPDKSPILSALSPSDVDGPSSLFRRPIKSQGPIDLVSVSPESYHRPTMSWNYSTSGVWKLSQPSASAPRVGTSNPILGEDISEPLFLGHTKISSEGGHPTESLASTPQMK